MGKDPKDDLDDEDREMLRKIEEQQQAASDWDAENPDPKR